MSTKETQSSASSFESLHIQIDEDVLESYNELAKEHSRKIKDFFLVKSRRQCYTGIGEGTPYQDENVPASLPITDKVTMPTDDEIPSDVTTAAINSVDSGIVPVPHYVRTRPSSFASSESSNLAISMHSVPSSAFQQPQSPSSNASVAPDSAPVTPPSEVTCRCAQLLHERLGRGSSTSPATSPNSGCPWCAQRHAIKIFKGGETSEFVLLRMALDDTVADCLEVLSTKRMFKMYDEFHHWNLYVTKNGLETRLAPDDKPLLIQLKWLRELGYCLEDGIHGIPQEDLSFYFRFFVSKYSRYQLISSTDIECLVRKNTMHSGDSTSPTYKAALVAQNMYNIPVVLFQYANALQTVDFSRNKMLYLSSDFCKAATAITSFVFSNNEIDKIPASIIYFAPTLISLDLSHNFLQQESLHVIGRLTKLQHLNLECNRIKSIPESFANLKSLISLNLSNNYMLQFPGIIFSLGQLVKLNVAYNFLSQLPDSGFERLLKLASLNLSRNLIRSLPLALGQLPALSKIVLHGNCIECCDVLFANHTLLSKVDCEFNSIKSVSVGNAPACTSLSFSRNPLTTLHLAFVLPELRNLSLARCNVSALPSNLFYYCSSLLRLNVSGNQLTHLPESITCLSVLENLDISNNKLESLDATGLAQLATLDAHANNIRTLASAFWSQCPRLHTLNLSSNRLFALPPAPENMSAVRLVSFSAAENLLDDSVCVLFGVMPSLRVLNLSFNRNISDVYPISLLHNLEELYLSGIGLRSIPADIGSLKQLRILYVDLNRISNVPGELQNCANLQVLDISQNWLNYNIFNAPYDWNWNSNHKLAYLNLAGNSKLHIGDSIDFASLFRGCLQSLRWLNFCGVKCEPNFLIQCNSSIFIQQATENAGIAESFSSASFSLSTFVAIKRDLIACGDTFCCMVDGGCSFAKIISENFSHVFKRNFACINDETSFASAIRKTFLDLNMSIAGFPDALSAGCTGIMVYKSVEGVVYSANIGDTMAVLCREGRGLVFSSRHHARNAHEVWRLRSVGGFIDRSGNVDGAVPLSKSFGYLAHLPFVSASPSIYDIILEPADHFIIIACKGLWEVISYQTAVDIVYRERENFHVAARKLRDFALAYGATRTVSVVILGVHEDATASLARQETPVRSVHMLDHASRMDTTIARLDREISPPMGEVTLVFTDIKGSTGLWQLSQAAMKSALQTHHEVMRRLLRTIGGYEFKTEGDAFMVAFADVQSALKWSLSVQVYLVEADWPKEIFVFPDAAEIPLDAQGCEFLYRGLKVRIGIHTGQPFCEVDSVSNRTDYWGVDLSIASRIRDAADGGQIFVSAAVYEELMKRGLPHVNDRLSPIFVPMGARSLKGIQQEVHVYAVYPSCLGARHNFCVQTRAMSLSTLDARSKSLLDFTRAAVNLPCSSLEASCISRTPPLFSWEEYLRIGALYMRLLEATRRFAAPYPFIFAPWNAPPDPTAYGNECAIALLEDVERITAYIELTGVGAHVEAVRAVCDACNAAHPSMLLRAVRQLAASLNSDSKQPSALRPIENANSDAEAAPLHESVSESLRKLQIFTDRAENGAL